MRRRTGKNAQADRKEWDLTNQMMWVIITCAVQRGRTSADMAQW